MASSYDVQIVSCELYWIPVKTRVPLKFGSETLTTVTCARTCVTVRNSEGKEATGWGETPLNIQWIWPASGPYEERHAQVKNFCLTIQEKIASWQTEVGHPIEISYDILERQLPNALRDFNTSSPESSQSNNGPMPWLAALVAFSPFDIALHDAYGKLHGLAIYETYKEPFMSRDLSRFLEPDAPSFPDFKGQYPCDYLVQSAPDKLMVWHLVGGLDPLEVNELTGQEPDDGYPITLRDWIDTDGLKALKVKLRGSDWEWDWNRLVSVGKMAIEKDVSWLSADFNCTVHEPNYVNEIMDRLRDEFPRIYGMVLYVEQPFPYDLEKHQIDAHSVAARKPLFLDESAHDWKVVRHGRQLGWTGVALKTCKTQTGAILSACWAKAHGMTLMVQDLTNPMLAQIPHVQLAAHVGTIMGVESNGMQFYPEASIIESEVHPGLYKRRKGILDLSTIAGAGMGYRLDDMPSRDLTPASKSS